MSWPEAFAYCVGAVCVMIAVIHVFADGINITITHRKDGK